MQVKKQQCVRALLLTPSDSVLLMKMAFSNPTRQLWITPGGRIEPGETPLAALARELREETGLRAPRIGEEIWTREHTFAFDGVEVEERERFFLVRTERFEPVTSGFEADERRSFRGFRWWSVAAIARSPERFAPARLGPCLADLLADGVPSRPVAVGA